MTFHRKDANWKDANWQKLSLLGVHICRFYQLPVNLWSNFNWRNVKLATIWNLSYPHYETQRALDHSLLSHQENLHMVVLRIVLDAIWACTWALLPHSVPTILHRPTQWWKQRMKIQSRSSTESKIKHCTAQGICLSSAPDHKSTYWAITGAGDCGNCSATAIFTQYFINVIKILL